PGWVVGHFSAFLYGSSATRRRAHCVAIGTFGSSWGIPGINEHILTGSSVGGRASGDLVVAQCLPAFATVFAVAACAPQPGITGHVTDFEIHGVFTQFFNYAHPFVPGDKRWRGLDRPVTFHCV